MEGATRGVETKCVSRGALLLLVLLATLPKLAILLAPRDDLYATADSARGTPYHGEEIHRGNTAVEILNGPILPLQDYHYAPFFGGSLVVSLLATPLIAIFGSSIAVLKLTGLMFNAAMVVFLVLAMARLAGPRVALLAGLLAALPPPGYTVLSITAFGSHVESNAFAMFLLWAFACLWWQPRDEQEPRSSMYWLRAFLAGAVAGFATYFGYIILLTVAALFVAAWIRDRRFLLCRETHVVLVGFGVGFLPWWTYNLPRGFPGLTIYGRDLIGGAESGEPGVPLAERLQDLFTRALPDAPAFRDFELAGAHTQGLLYVGALGLAILFALALATFRRGAADSRTPSILVPLLLLQPAFFLLAFALSDFRVGGNPDVVGSFRYLHVLWPWLWCAAAAGLGILSRLGRGAVLPAWVGAAAIGGLAACGEARLIDWEKRGSTLDIRAHSYSAFGRFVLLSFAERPHTLEAALDAAVSKRGTEDLDLFLFGMGMQLKESERGRARVGKRMQHFREMTGELRELIRPRVPAKQRAYFEAWSKGEPAFGAKDRDGRVAFWEWYRARSTPEPVQEDG